MQRIIQYFIRGLLFLFPVVATIIMIIFVVKWADHIFNSPLERWLGTRIPGTGIIFMLVIVFLVGIASSYFNRPLNLLIEGTIARMPLIKIIYTGLRDFSEAFIGEKRKFNKPVMVKMTENAIYKLGFITRDDLSAFGLKNYVAVYFPHSYNFSGNLFLVPCSEVIPLELNSAEYMKFIVSAAVMSMEDLPDKRQSGQNQLN